MSKVSGLLTATHKDPNLVYKIGFKTTAQEAAKIMKAKNIGALLVVGEGKLLGIVSERDIVRKVDALGKNASRVPVFEIMTWHPDTVTPFTDLVDCMALMEKKGFRHVPVMQGEEIVGIVSIRDILVALVRHQELIAMNLQAYITGPGF